VILRGNVDDEKLAAPEKEAAIARACLRGKWTSAMLACVGGSNAPRSCLDQLTAAQHTTYLKSLTAWNEIFPDEEVAELDKPEPLDDDDEPIDCITATTTAEHLAPALAQQGADRPFAVAVRRDAVELACEDWSNAVRACFVAATPPKIDACRGQLEPDQAKLLVAKLAEGDALLAKIATLAGKPAASDCAKVVAVFYSDAEWKARGPAATPKTAKIRRKMIADSRTAMKKACAGEKWTGQMRACIVAGSRETCFTAFRQSIARWSFPAAGVIVKTGISECDAYGATLQKLATCSGMPKRSIEALQGTFAQEAAGYATGTAAERAAAGPHCKTADEAIRRAAQSFNCTIP